MKFTNHIIFIFILLTGCSKHENTSGSIISSISSLETFDNKKHKVVLIMPSTGCSGCISATEEFVKENKYSSLLLILTNSTSRKDAIHRLDLVNPLCDYYWDSDNVFHDSNNELSVYPKIVYWDEKDKFESKVDIISPENPEALFELRQFLMELTF